MRFPFTQALGFIVVSALSTYGAGAARAAEPRAPLIFSLESTGTVQSDGLGNYVDAQDTVSAYAFYQSQSDYHLSVDQGRGLQRTVRYDLSSPVVGGGGTAIAPFNDKTADFAGGALLNLAVGETRAVDLHLYMTISRKSYRLSFGDHPLIAGDQGAGTTLTQVTRVNESTWTVVAPAGSVGRLWKPGKTEVNLGLFNQEFSFTVYLK